MSRYFVVLQPPRRGPYVVAEVVREEGDDGRFRDVSLAANLAGENANIVTESELLSIEGGRVAYQRWRAGDDTPFRLDSMVQDLATWEELIAAYPKVEPARRRIAGGDTRHRLSHSVEEASALRAANQRARQQLRALMDEARGHLAEADRLFDAIGQERHKSASATEVPNPGSRRQRRRLRSVS